jgi:hypothetical protein
MPFVKGKIKTGGKKKGVVNKKTQEAAMRVEYVLSLLEETIEDDIKLIEPKERVKMWDNLQEYIRPKMQRTEITGKDGEKLITEINVNIKK